MFDLLWLCGWSLLALPLALASWRGWAPRWVRLRLSPAGVRVRGVALLVLWASGMVTPVIRLSGLDDEESAFLASPAQFGLMMFAAGLMCGSQLAERFASRQPQRDTPR
ncbi:hypothetical protein [Streptomyces sp. NPDC096132]|uniref:hypothetical protein n=1 Tax=Streptomyces sp. NPDC096132 TaxID=3366075 RepID=UPI0038293550